MKTRRTLLGSLNGRNQMRKASTLAALTLMAVAANARAQGPEPAAPPAPVAPVPDAMPPAPPPPIPAPGPPAAAPVPAAPAPVLVLPAVTPTPPNRKLQLGVSVLAMGLGSFTSSPGGMPMVADASFSYGFGLLAGYEILPGLSLGIAPQAIFNVGPKSQPGAAAKEYDLFARVAYSLTLVETIALYVEALPGYSTILPAVGDPSTGLVLDFGGGCRMDLSDRTFVSVGVGLQMGYQKVTFNTVDPVTMTKLKMDVDTKTEYTRVALTGGVKF